VAQIGYCRVSTDGQTLAPQLDALRAAGCDLLFQEHASGVDRTRPELARALAACCKGDTLIFTKLDRIARSQIHLLEIAELLRKRGAGLRSLGDPIDTTTLGGRLMFGMLAAFAEFERGLIVERTLSGLAAARARGRIGGNPMLRTPEGRAQLAAIRAEARQMRKEQGGSVPSCAIQDRLAAD
jgi:DNA invertase Pin-like site-specific DNA recombinase